jgi:hypothetical protein
MLTITLITEDKDGALSIQDQNFTVFDESQVICAASTLFTFSSPRYKDLCVQVTRENKCPVIGFGNKQLYEEYERRAKL